MKHYPCPVCGQKTARLHSHYRRTVADLPWGGRSVRLSLLVRRFRCSAPECPRRIFAERLASVVEPYARKTTRLHEIVRLVAFALPAGLGDIAIGVAAPFVARRLAHGTDRTRAVRFNVLGILDLIVAVSIALLLFEFVEVTPSTAPLRLLPLALIPTAPVPLALALHIVSLRRLGTAAKPE